MNRKEAIKILFEILDQAERERLECAEHEAARGVQYFRDRLVLPDEVLNERFTI